MKTFGKPALKMAEARDPAITATKRAAAQNRHSRVFRHENLGRNRSLRSTESENRRALIYRETVSNG